MPSFLVFALGALPAVLAATFDVSVGAGGQLAYDPPFVNAVPGDVVNFVFHPKNHTVTQSSFDTPCVALDGGKRSGFMPVAAETDGLPNFQFQVVDTTPAWFYCGQTGHCGQGMVFAVNPPAEPSPRSFTAFRNLAIATNGTASSSASAASSTVSSAAATDGYVTPPAPHFETVTVTVTLPSSTYTTVYNSYDGTPPPTPAPQPQDHKVTVGADGQLAYSPANIQAAIGDTVTFEFRPKNHTVTQSNFNNPCQPLFDTTGKVGFSSGFMPVSPDATQFPTFQIKINDTAPIWGYCGQTGHCGSGMVFSINAVESGPNNFVAFQGLAKRINGTSSSSSSAPAPTSSANQNNSNSAAGARAGFGYASSLVLAMVALVSLW
ncbi:hypothetical protein EYR40_000329 [Pleurotus pulmonarius]|nr:hypothetical protein EYR36_001310 [Pleurotus pulmonarius]KAF4607988.1 hypothetical protein EYR40_000329 [Pleurotus pulmonarius]